MRGVDLGAKVRGIERITGCTILVHYDATGKATAFDAWRDDNTHLCLQEVIGNGKNAPETALKKLHSVIYRINGKLAYIRQRGKCCFCGIKMPPLEYETDHKHGRGRGRSDRIEDLQVCCTGFNGCDGHRRKHGQGG